jgi:hypothetical protein
MIACQLDDVAGGNWLGDFSRWVGHAVKSFFQKPVVASIARHADPDRRRCDRRRRDEAEVSPGLRAN